MRGQLAEGRGVLHRLLDRISPDEDPATRAAVQSARGGISYWQMDVPAMTASYGEAVRLYERLGDHAELAEALYNLAFPQVQSRDFEEGERLARRSEELYAELGEDHGVARALWLRSLPAMHAHRLDE